MEKTEAVNKLKKAGYQVQFDSSVVTVLLEKRASITQEIKKLRSYLQEIGYDASFGVKQMKDDSVSDKDEVVLKKEKLPVQEYVEEVNEQEPKVEVEENWEIGEQFSLEDFGIS